MATHYEGPAAWYFGPKNAFALGSGANPGVTYRPGSAHEDGFCRSWEDPQAISDFRALDSTHPMLFYVHTQGAQPVWIPLPHGSEFAMPVQVQSQLV